MRCLVTGAYGFIGREVVGALQREVDRLMDHINDLLDPEYRWDPNPEGDGLKGVARFL